MLNFTDDILYAKGTCNILLSDINTGDICFQTTKANTAMISPSVALEEVRAGDGNPMVAMIPADSGINIDFEAADFSMWGNSVMLGTNVNFGASVPKCQVIEATGFDLKIDTSEGVPVPAPGYKKPVCYIQTVNENSFAMEDGIAYLIDENGNISDFTASIGNLYKVWYYVQSVASEEIIIESLMEPKVVRFDAKVAVYSNRTGGMNHGTRVGWLYVTIPYMKLKADGAISGDNNSFSPTKISGQAMAYEENNISTLSNDIRVSTLGYYVYAPDSESLDVNGIVVLEGMMYIPHGVSVQIPVRLVMGDRALVEPADYSKGFTYTVTSGSRYVEVNEYGVATGIDGGAEGHEAEILVTYVSDTGEEFSCPVRVTVGASPYIYSSLVGYGLVGYMRVGVLT